MSQHTEGIACLASVLSKSKIKSTFNGFLKNGITNSCDVCIIDSQDFHSKMWPTKKGQKKHFALYHGISVEAKI